MKQGCLQEKETQMKEHSMLDQKEDISNKATQRAVWVKARSSVNFARKTITHKVSVRWTKEKRSWQESEN